MSNNFREELRELINRHSMENLSNTPDFLLTEYILGCLEAFDSAVRQREAWYGRTKETLPSRCIP